MIDFEVIESRFSWARYQRNLLDQSVKNYSKRHPLLFRTEIAEDRMSWTVSSKVGVLPPLQKWAFRYADIIHNLRSLLDNYVWLVAHDNKNPVQPGKLKFPIVLARSKWPDATAGIAELDSTHQQLIKSLQPFERDTQDLIGSTLKLIHALDIQNKHHSLIVTGVSDTQQIEHKMKVNYKEEISPTDTVDLTFHRFKYEDNFTVMHQTAPKPILNVKGSFKLETHFAIQDENGGSYPVIGSLDHMLKGTKKVIKHLKALN